ncbi:MAG: CvpA family protein [Mariprofundaceae bacterium]|nr:CvpA family protein [Mariprofundaceae bacterium]
MNFFDYILIGIVGLSVVLSLWRGFVREIISLIGLVAAFFIASRTSGQAGDLLGQWISNGTVADIAGFALVFVLIMLIVGIIGVIIRKLVDMADLTTTDRTLGIFFGAARGLLLISLAFLIYTSYANPDHKWMKESMLTPYAIQAGEMIGKSIPEGYPFSRKGGAAITAAPQEKSATEKVIDRIPVADKKELESIIQDSMK